MSGNAGIDNISSEYKVTRDSDDNIVNRAIKTVSNASVNFLPNTLNAATTHVFWQVITADINVRFDQGAATTSDMFFDKNNSAIWSKQMAFDARAIRNAALDATIIIYELQKGSPQSQAPS